MTFKQFKRKVGKAESVAIITSAMEPIALPNRIAFAIVDAALKLKRVSKESGFSGRMYVAMLPMDLEGSFVMVVGVDSAHPVAEEVTP